MAISYRFLPVSSFQDLFSEPDLARIAKFEWDSLLSSARELQTLRLGSSSRIEPSFLEMARQTHLQRWGHLPEPLLSHMESLSAPPLH